MEVKFDLSRETLVELKGQFEKDITVYESVVADIRDNIARIEAALNPAKSVSIPSSSNPNLSYRVTRTYVSGWAPGKYTCSCPSFQFGRGLDDRSRCKHIRQAQAEGL